MSNPHAAAAAPQKTPSYAWPCLIVSLLCAVTIVFAWQWLPGVTFPIAQDWWGTNTPGYEAPLVANVMGLVPIGALIAAFPTSIVVRKWGPKFGTCLGMIIAIIGMVVSSLANATDYTIFLVGRFILGLGLSTTIVSGPTCVSVWFPHGTRGRAMAIWSCWAPIGIFTINAIGLQLLGAVGNDLTNLQWVLTVVLVVALVIFFFVFRSPKGDEVSEVSPELKPFKEIAYLFKQRQLWCLFIMFAVFNFMNYSFSTYLKSWLQLGVPNGGMGWDPTLAGLLGGAIVACGILAPLGGFILDKLPKQLKYVAVVAGIVSLTLASVFAFHNDVPMFAAYILFFCIGNMFLNGCCRPMVPTLVFKGGATAVALGLSFLTCAQYLGQIPMSYVLHDFAGSMTARHADPMLAFWALVPVGIVGIILSFLMKPSKKEAAAMKAGGGKPGGGAPGGGAPSGGAPEAAPTTGGKPE
jgi:MFS family permease